MQTGITQSRQTSNAHYHLFFPCPAPACLLPPLCVNNSGRYAFPRRSVGTRNEFAEILKLNSENLYAETRERSRSEYTSFDKKYWIGLIVFATPFG